MSGDPSQSTPASETQSERASAILHGHVNSIKSKLGFDNPNSPLGRLAAHTKRKMAELEAARAAGIKAAPGSPDWQAAMKPDSFGKGFIKANRTQFLITSGVFSLGLFWLLVIRFVHHDANAAQTGNSEAAQRALANQHMAGMAGMPAPQSPQAPQTFWGTPVQPQGAAQPIPVSSPASFGSPNASFGAPNNGGAYPQYPPTQPAPAFQPPAFQQPVQFVPSAQPPLQIAPSTAQMYSPYAQQVQGYGAQTPASNFAPQQHLYPVRQHTTARHQVVVNR
ncbi:MAG: hypothetical protein JST89_15720 [Cyanobacteria bacterium SZAS-4]|nr:hypothetical protein [Cyanobacteria bacterium SZAS-4]